MKSESICAQNLHHFIKPSVMTKDLTNPALLKSMDIYTKKFIHFILKGQRDQEYSNCKKKLEKCLDEWKKRNQVAYSWILCFIRFCKCQQGTQCPVFYFKGSMWFNGGHWIRNNWMMKSDASSRVNVTKEITWMR